MVPTSALRQEPPIFTAITGADGRFSISNVPTILGDISVRATVIDADGMERTVSSAEVSAVRGGITEIGKVRVP